MLLNHSEILSLKERIRSQAEQEGFVQVGFTIPEKSDTEILGELFSNWIDKRFHAGMDWFISSIEKRIDVKKYFPEVQSIIVFMISYYHQDDENWSHLPFKIARYAHGKDYHKVLRKKLTRIAGKIRADFPEFQYKITVDSSPIAERYWARKAGLGWIGRNSMLISPRYGSYTFLSTMLTNIPFSPDSPFDKNLCGKCNRCVVSCPTDAILDNKIVDSNRCISYLTIEHNSEIPSDVLKKFNGWIFGCDICQEVCPWNSKKLITTEERFGDQYPHDELEKACLNEEVFNKFFEGTPVRRAGYSHFKYVLMSQKELIKYIRRELICLVNILNFIYRK